ncbi:hypothetical protein [Absidia glauca]|uniref:HAUS augmin-like complex subunit 4 n=1 Tax=Absidia glauca TaxID=4829 RepID=A0A168N200_ABSGL|nr:hypothetical protein [Absidia glauca]
MQCATDGTAKDDGESGRHQRLIDAELKDLLTDPKVILTETEDKEAITSILDEAIQTKYDKVGLLISQYHPGLGQVIPIQQDTAHLLVSSVQQLSTKIQNSKFDLTSKKLMLSNEMILYVKVILELLDIIWLIIQEFKYKSEKEKNQTFDNYLGSMVDSLLLRIRSLHVTIMTATYDEGLVASLTSLRNMLNQRLDLATKEMAEQKKLLDNYQHMGPLFEKLRKAYGDVLEQIKAIEDDIQRMKRR